MLEGGTFCRNESASFAGKDWRSGPSPLQLDSRRREHRLMRRKGRRWLTLLLAVFLIVPGGWAAPAAAREPADIPVLLYHVVKETPTNEWNDVSIADFHKQMKYLYDHGYTTLSSEEYVAIMEGRM